MTATGVLWFVVKTKHQLLTMNRFTRRCPCSVNSSIISYSIALPRVHIQAVTSPIYPSFRPQAMFWHRQLREGSSRSPLGLNLIMDHILINQSICGAVGTRELFTENVARHGQAWSQFHHSHFPNCVQTNLHVRLDAEMLLHYCTEQLQVFIMVVMFINPILLRTLLVPWLCSFSILCFFPCRFLCFALFTATLTSRNSRNTGFFELVGILNWIAGGRKIDRIESNSDNEPLWALLSCSFWARVFTLEPDEATRARHLCGWAMGPLRRRPPSLILSLRVSLVRLHPRRRTHSENASRARHFGVLSFPSRLFSSLIVLDWRTVSDC